MIRPALSFRPARRRFLRTGAACVAAVVTPLPAPLFAQTPTRDYELRLTPARQSLVGSPHPETAVWSYNGTVPGPEIRARQGERLRVVVRNDLEVETTVHWHGIRLPNAMDGVPHLTQPPIKPGGRFVYEFGVPDAGTFWYHPHLGSSEQLDRGLYGALIVEERTPPEFDRDVVWVLDDWRLDRGAQVRNDFGSRFDAVHEGRIGNTVTVNGAIRETFALRTGERMRLRLINAANARIFGLEFDRHRPWIIALDGQPVAPHEPEGGRIVLGPGMRADVVLHGVGRPGTQHPVRDTHYRGHEYRLLDLVYDAVPLRSPDEFLPPAALPGNPLAEPDLARAVREDLVLAGGAMGSLRSARVNGKETPIREMVMQGLAWALNGRADNGHAGHHGGAPLFTWQRGRTYHITVRNDTAWTHPMHLHGHSFRVLARDGSPVPHRPWMDTVLVAPRETVEIALVADNPGDWMLHCHILEHQEAGMMAFARVT